MKLTALRTKAPAVLAPAEPVVEPGADASRAAKGRPTPKRRDSEPRQGPVAPAPKTRREALARQRQLLKSGAATGPGAMSAAQRRQRMWSGDEAQLRRRDAGPFRKLARNYVDSRRMLSNLLLILFPLSFAPVLIKGLQLLNIVVVVMLVTVIAEWIVTGRRLTALAHSRGIDTGRDSSLAIGAYAGMRAYLPRGWRMPRAQVGLGDAI